MGGLTYRMRRPTRPSNRMGVPRCEKYPSGSILRAGPPPAIGSRNEVAWPRWIEFEVNGLLIFVGAPQATAVDTA